MVLCLDFLRSRSASGRWLESELLRNIVLGRPAWQSSVCYWSNIKDARLDAEGGNNGLVEVDYGFHTDTEQNPWWAVDLQDFYAVDAVEIYNRRTFAERLSEFRLL